MSAPEVITFGCRLNAYESEVMRGLAGAAGLADAVIVNTCAVTGEAERQARQAIRKARRARPEARIIVTGCAAQIDPAAYAAMPEVDQVLGNEDKLVARNWRPEATEDVVVNDIMSVRETAGHLITGLEGRARAFVQVQNGCDHRCTFCVIPFGRGNSRSVPLGRIVEQVRELAANGYREVVLTGVDITDYGKDLPGRPTLGQTIRRLLAQVPELERLRLSSIDVAEVDPALLDLIASEPRLMPHLHLSLQAGDDVILKRMKRRHSRAQAVEFCDRVRRLRPDVVLGADLIAGFPTETEAMFESTLRLVADCGLVWLHVFPYSARRGTPAARMPQVDGRVRKDRAARLRKAGEDAVARYLATQVGRTVPALVETETTARTDPFAMAQLDGRAEPGDVVPIEVTGTTGRQLLARAA